MAQQYNLLENFHVCILENTNEKLHYSADYDPICIYCADDDNIEDIDSNDLLSMCALVCPCVPFVLFMCKFQRKNLQAKILT